MQSIREVGVASVGPESVMGVGAESKRRGAAESGTMSVTVRATESGAVVFTMSVTGRMVAGGAAVLTASMTGGLEESAGGGGGVGEGETVTRIGGVGG